MKSVLLAAAAALSLLAVGVADDAGESAADPTCNGAKTHDWRAWNNRMPMSDQAVHVTGKVTVNSGGWKTALTKRGAPGTNTSLLSLNLELSPPRGPAIQPILDLKLHYTETNAASKYTRVHVFCGDARIADIPVEETH